MVIICEPVGGGVARVLDEQSRRSTEKEEDSVPSMMGEGSVGSAGGTQQAECSLKKMVRQEKRRLIEEARELIMTKPLGERGRVIKRRYAEPQTLANDRIEEVQTSCAGSVH